MPFFYLPLFVPEAYDYSPHDKSSPKVYKLDFNSDKMIFVSGELGNGAIHYDKDLDKIKIVFNINEQTTWTISK